MFPSTRINKFQSVFHDVVTLAYMNVNTILEGTRARHLGPKAGYTRAESNRRTLCRYPKAKLVRHHMRS